MKTIFSLLFFLIFMDFCFNMIFDRDKIFRKISGGLTVPELPPYDMKRHRREHQKYLKNQHHRFNIGNERARREQERLNKEYYKKHGKPDWLR